MSRTAAPKANSTVAEGEGAPVSCVRRFEVLRGLFAFADAVQLRRCQALIVQGREGVRYALCRPTSPAASRLPCAARARRGLAQTRLRLKQSRALIRLPLRCSAAPQRPAQGIPHACVDRPDALTPALSRREREQGGDTHPQSLFHSRRPVLLPLPLGEGWGEGAGPPRCTQRPHTPKPGMRCGLGDPLCGAEERSLSRIRARDCLSEASASETPRKASTAGKPRRGRRSGVDRPAPLAGRASNRPFALPDS